jgi:3-dehydroquinate synthase
MGCGKTTIGEALAQRLGMPFLDTDRLIEAESGKTIREIFETKGEAGFRSLERAAVQKACRLRNTVVAVGGGALLDTRNLSLVRHSGVTIGLTASPEVILGRTRGDGHRPLVSGGSEEKGLSRIQELLEPRRSSLEGLDCVIDTSSRDVPECLRIALAVLEEKRFPATYAGAEETVSTADARTVRVDPPGSDGYSVLVGEGVLTRCGALLRDLEASRGFRTNQTLVITNHLLDLLYGSTVRASLTEAGFRTCALGLPDGEASKSLGTAVRAYDYMASKGMGRDTVVLALGGGVVGDLAGFVAATYMRGVPFVQIPTSLLAQVDASVGGKVAVNHPAAKNLIGSFYHPLAVLADTRVLESLPEREYVEGLAEIVKYGIAIDAGFFELLERNAVALLRRDRAVLSGVVVRCCEIKAAVVERDEKDRGQRAVLNFGHTIGHAVEAESGYGRMRHGEAVSVGMSAAMRIARKMGLMPESDASRGIGLLQKLGLPTETASRLDSLRPFLVLDKKSKGGKMTFVLPTGLGKCTEATSIEPSRIEEALRSSKSETEEAKGASCEGRPGYRATTDHQDPGDPRAEFEPSGDP